jgi:rhodanese-related sulfurtransferase
VTDPEYELEPGRVKEMLDAGEAEVIDVRRPDEREAEYIAGTRHVELASLQAAADSIDRGRPVVFYCHVGERSAMATDAFRAGGFDAYHLRGGIEAWMAEGLPVKEGG